MVRILTESEVESLLDMRAAVDVVEQALLDQACGKSTNRSRYRIALPRTMLNVMAAGVSTFHALGVKCYVVGQTGPGGAHIYLLLFDSEIGKLLAIMQADKLGQMRTGAASVVVYSRSKRRREDFAIRISERLGLALEPTSAPEEPAAQEIVVTATSSEE